MNIAAINAGVFSQLVVAHLGDRIERAGKAETGAAALNARVEAQAAVVADLKERVEQIDTAIAEMIRRGRDALAAIDQQRQNRETLVARWCAEVEQLASLKASAAAAKQEATVVRSETAPIAYVATMLGAERRDAVRWLILLMVLCADSPGDRADGGGGDRGAEVNARSVESGIVLRCVPRGGWRRRLELRRVSKHQRPVWIVVRPRQRD